MKSPPPHAIILTMINKSSLAAVEQSRFSTAFTKPLYDSYCFSNIPQTIKNILLQEKKPALPNDIFGNLPRTYDKVVLFLIDGFGWKFFERYAHKYPFLKYILNNGVVSQLTTQFPSTTAAELTTIHTGLPVGESGVYEWLYYEPQVDAIIYPLLFSFAGKRERDNLKPTGIDPQDLYPKQTIYKDLSEKGINSHIFQFSEYATSPYCKVTFQGGKVTPYLTFPEALTNLVNTLHTDKEKSYYFIYFDGIDKMAHHYGPNSEQFAAEVDAFFYAMEQLFLNKLKGKPSNTLFMLTADHGHASIDPKTTIYLNEKFPKIKQWIKTNKKGELLVPAGSCRDMFLHIKEEYLDQAHTFLQDALVGKAEVYKVDDLIREHFFGIAKPSKTFLERVGNLVILCYNNESVWWYEKDKFEIKYYGHHGGLTPEEVETMLLCFTLP
jgi:predicted AlkP superfamily pyrophosphatase or phosphodiesterase